MAVRLCMAGAFAVWVIFHSNQWSTTGPSKVVVCALGPTDTSMVAYPTQSHYPTTEPTSSCTTETPYCQQEYNVSYPTQSHYYDTETNSPFPIRVMLNAC